MLHQDTLGAAEPLINHFDPMANGHLRTRIEAAFDMRETANVGSCHQLRCAGLERGHFIGKELLREFALQQ